MNDRIGNILAPLKRAFSRRPSKEDWEFEWQKNKWVEEYKTQEVKDKVHDYWVKYRHLEDIQREVSFNHNTRILDVGCGISSVLHYLPGIRTGIDPLADRYKEIYPYPDEINIENAYAEALPFADELFDVVFCSNCIDHTTDPKAAIREIYRVLRPTGYFVLTCETFSENLGERNVGHPHSIDRGTLQSLVSDFMLIAQWESPWYGLRNYSLGRPPTEQVENIYLLRRPAEGTE